MKVQTTDWQQTTLERINRTAGQENEQQDKQIEDIKEKMEEAQKSFSALPNQTSPTSGNNKIKASVPDDNVAQLASELANCHTKLDVQQVSGKAARALASLRMSGALSEGKDKEKIAQMIRRMQKLIKRARTKLKNLTKEEDLERRQKRAEEKKREQEARTLLNELRNKRNKRHKDEWDYARKEAAHGNQSNAADNILPGSQSQSALSTPPAAEISAPVTAEAAVAVEAAAPVSLDVTV